METKIRETRRQIYDNLTAWQRVQLARHIRRPFALDYVSRCFTHWVELHGDRLFRDDKAMPSGLAKLGPHRCVVITHQKGRDTKENVKRNFGCAHPEGYRKALRLMKMAEKFNRPVITLIDTPGAYPGLEAEERGQGEAIARNLFEMINLKVPVICVIIGEGASGGALGIGIGDKVVMLENTWYTVISPESCSSILWRSWNYKEKAAEELKLTSEDMSKFGLVDGVIKEPVGGAHAKPEEMAETLKKYLLGALGELNSLGAETRIQQRIDKFSKMGFYEELDEIPNEIEDAELGVGD
jgi:acetyl-CoA carboxylase carboxyl transferase subunit alpha